ncbi:Pteridine reductase 1 [Diplonema papillatum]|nr:Pteridine reductase 1 [Diplonema papillatum]
MAGRKVALVTGGGRRIGSAIVRRLHAESMNVVIHYNESAAEAASLAAELNAARPDSAVALRANLKATPSIERLAEEAASCWQRVDTLVNNASTFHPTELGCVTESAWEDLMWTNAKAPYFLAQALLAELRRNRGCVVNIADVHASRPLRDHSVYCMAKAANVMMVQSLAKDLAPIVRVNCVSPGPILWPESEPMTPGQQAALLRRTPLQALGSPDDIAAAVKFLVFDAPYVTGHNLAVDGGRLLS